jgi:hypothetical protein
VAWYLVKHRGNFIFTLREVYSKSSRTNLILVRIGPMLTATSLTNSMQQISWETDSHSVKKFSSCYVTRNFSTVFKRARHWSLSWEIQIQSTPYHPISLTSTQILSSHPRLRFPNGLFSLGFPTKILYAFLIYPCVLHAQPIESSLIWSPELYLV